MTSLNDLDSNRCALLLAEIGCWIHMLGKLDRNFPISKAHNNPPTQKYDYKKDFLNNVSPTLCNLIKGKWVTQFMNSIPHIPDSTSFPPDFSLFQFSTQHANRENSVSILKILFDAHGLTSGIEKGVAVEEMSQSITETYISTSFGYEYNEIINNLNWPNIQNNVFTSLEKTLNKIKIKNINLSEEEWWNLVRDLRYNLETSFRHALGDTRRPLNHISLFDQTVSTVAFYKAELGRIALDGWREPVTTDFNRKHKFRLLRINYNGMRFWGETDTIGDLKARKALLDEMVLNMERIITCRFPLGYLAYKDENDAVFLVPDSPSILSLAYNNESLETLIKRESSTLTEGEVIPVLHVGKKESRWAATLGSILDADISEPCIDTVKIAASWENTSREICSVCGIRPQGDSAKAKNRKICNTCLDRRWNRCEEWSRKLDTTLWIDEVSDNNGRIALIVGKFYIKDWINGKLINTLLGRLLPSISQNWNQPLHTFKEITEEIKKELSKRDIGKKTPFLESLVSGTNIKKGLPKNETVKALYELLVVHREEGGASLETPPTIENAEMLFQALFAQETSFARIRRIWETTRQFWQDMLPLDEDDITHSETREVTGITGPRLLMKGDITVKSGLPLPYHAYEIVHDESGTRISVVWDEKRQGFIVVENLLYIQKLLGEELKNLKGKLKIEEPTGYGAKNRDWGLIDVKEVTEIPESEYVPAIPILAEPSTFMALVPADKAFELVKRIKAKYECEMGRVRNRLPLKVGIIFTHQYTPLRVILDAGQRMINAFPPTAMWEVTSTRKLKNSDPCSKETIQISMQNNKITWNVPVCMGDGKTEDNWYPYVFLQDWDNNPHPETRNRSIKTYCPWNNQLTWLVHVNDIHPGDTMYFTPALFDFEWLDTNSRRFEIAYEQDKRLGEKGIRRPYLLDDIVILENIWNTLKKTATNSQIHALRDTIEQKRREWNSDEVFRQFCRDTLATLQWTSPPWGNTAEKWLDEWADYAVKGWLSDALELYVQIMKKKSEVGGVKCEY